MRIKILVFIALLFVSFTPIEAASYKGWADTISLPDIEVSASRVVRPPTQQQIQISVIDSRLLNEIQAVTPKDVSQLIPNVYMPDYGSAMTSSIYIRGLGSRINEPAMGMVVDGVPLLDKNLYDHTMQDIKRIELLRGPQGSMYGRNSAAGVMEIRTLQPLDFTTYSVHGLVSYASANSVQAQMSFFQPIADSQKHKADFGWGVAARYQRTDGFYTNHYTGRKIDGGQQAGGRLVFDGKPSDEWRITGTLYADWVRQGAFPYASVATGRIDYNSPGSYERLAILPSLCADYAHEDWRLQLVVSYQFLRDDMHMDNDYTPASVFTLRQAQRIHGGTIDALLRAPAPCAWYDWMIGMSSFMKANSLQAPVVFMREGIDELILGNANRGIQTVFPEDSIEISDVTLPIPSTFDLLNAGVALYHQSNFHFGNWHINAGVRVDYEHTHMNYLSTADVNYRFTMLMSDFKTVQTRIQGTQAANYIQVLPRLAVSYDATWGTIYGYAAKGYKAGGYNPQMFSTVTQNQVMNDMAADMGLHLAVADPRFLDVAVTSYKPEKDWTFELGAHFTPVDGLKIDMDAFHIQCIDQQVTVFPNGKTTGRMMANAGRSRVWGVEAALHYRWRQGNWQGMADASYGFTDARFIHFNDGMGDYSGHFVPYAPQHTAHALVQAGYYAGRKWLRALSFSARTNIIGPIYWNEQNDCMQTPYALMAVNLTLEWEYAQLELWGRNLTNMPYNVFYFRSMGNDFLQRGKPRELGATIRFKI